MPRVMEMTYSSHAARSIFFTAASQLESGGYRTIRVAGTIRPFDIIAWKDRQILFLVIRRSRAGALSVYADTIRDLAGQVNDESIPGMVQFWIFRSQHWFRYRILPGGAVPLEWGAA
jgi:hypothetical protein